MKLRDYQLAIAEKATALLKEYHIAYLSMQVRTGKTLTALYAAQEYGAKEVLFVTKLKAISSIRADYDEFGFEFQLTTVNFESLHKIDGKHDLVIIDEAHSLGQFPIIANRSYDLKKICAGLPIIFLSGTPSPESYSQLFHQFFVSSFSPFAAYTNFYKWAKDYVNKKVKFVFNRQLNDYSDANKEKIDAKCRHLFLSLTQEEAGFVQYVEEVILHVEMKRQTYALARKLLKHRVHIGKFGEQVIADTEASMLQKLHQIYSGTCILEGGETRIFDLSKGEFIRQHFEGKKIAIFYKYKAELGILHWAFGVNYLTSDPTEFNNNDHLVFACQFQSGREGTNLSTADCLIFLNIDFSAVSYWQARARLQTKDREKPVLLYWIFAEGGIEDKIYRTVQNKKSYTTSYFRKDYDTTQGLER